MVDDVYTPIIPSKIVYVCYSQSICVRLNRDGVGFEYTYCFSDIC